MEAENSKEFIISEFKSGKTVKQIAIYFKGKESIRKVEEIIFEYIKNT